MQAEQVAFGIDRQRDEAVFERIVISSARG